MTHAHDPSEPTIRCRRVDARYSVAEHKDCPYCYGKASDVATGDHTKFCDFKPGQDPVCFGFPDREVDAAPPAPPAKEPAAVRCRRVDAVYTVAEHKDCPYCYGKASDVATGDHTKFCDFKPGQDPICFGFPDDTDRTSHG